MKEGRLLILSLFVVGVVVVQQQVNGVPLGDEDVQVTSGDGRAVSEDEPAVSGEEPMASGDGRAVSRVSPLRKKPVTSGDTRAVSGASPLVDDGDAPVVGDEDGVSGSGQVTIKVPVRPIFFDEVNQIIDGGDDPVVGDGDVPVAGDAMENVTCNYTIIASNVFRPGTPYKFSVDTKCISVTSYKIHASIQSEHQSNLTVLEKKVFDVKSGVTSLHFLRVPRVVNFGNHFFVVEAFNGLNFKRNTSIELKKKQFTIFIQTDKVLYKPGQKVQYRVIALSPDMTPFKLPMNITIKDSKDNRIVQVRNWRNDTGIFSGYLQLSDVTPFGSWCITAGNQNHNERAVFQVAEYVLPKFEVKLHLPDFYFVPDNEEYHSDLHVTIISEYTYKQPVKGVVLVEATLESYHSIQPGDPKATKIVMLKDGKAYVSYTYEELSALIRCPSEYDKLAYRTISITAKVTEISTGVTISAKGSVSVENTRYSLSFIKTARNFLPGFTFEAQLKLEFFKTLPPRLMDITHVNGTFKSIPVIVNMQVKNYSSLLEQRVLAQLNADGYAMVRLNISENIHSINLEAAFRDDNYNLTCSAYADAIKFETRAGNYLQLKLENQSDVFQPKKYTAFLINTLKPITSFHYQVLSKGILTICTTVHQANSTYHKFSIYVSPKMALELAPEAKVVVFYIDDTGEIIADSLQIKVLNFFLNKVDLTFNKNTTSPSDSVVLKVRADKNSYVGIVAVDKSVRLLNSGNQLTKTEIENDLVSYSSSSLPFFGRSSNWYEPVYGRDTHSLLQNAGLAILTNNHVHEHKYRYSLHPQSEAHNFVTYDSGPEHVSQSLKPSSASPKQPAARTEFPETWLWMDIIKKYNDEFDLQIKVPDTITSWVASAFAVNDKSGIGVTDVASEITVERPLFISMNLPHSVIRGEEFGLHATIFNYLHQDVDVSVVLKQSSFFKTRICRGDQTYGDFYELDAQKVVKVAQQDAESVFFWIVPRELGQISIEMSAQAGVAADSIKLQLLVEPEGEMQSYTSSSYIQPTLEHPSNIEFQVSLPPADILVPGSAVVQVTAIGDMFATTKKNSGYLQNLPAGCGEQNILNFAPNVFLLQYYNATDHIDHDFKMKALDLIRTSYQKQLTFRRDDASYSAFGNDDSVGSVWLSAFVLKSFNEARKIIITDEEKNLETLKWILKHQSDDGSFSEPPGGKVIHTRMQGGSASNITITAYVVIALKLNMESHNFEGSDESILKARIYLENIISSHTNNSYILSIVAYALYLTNSAKLPEVLDLLDDLAVNKNELKYWKSEITEHPNDDLWMLLRNPTPTHEIEMTSYALLVYASQRNITKALPIARWLATNFNEYGGFTSTQDTVLALEALIKFAALISTPKESKGVKVTIEGDVEGETFQLETITPSTSLVMQTVKLNKDTTTVKVNGSGNGFALVQLLVKYNVLERFSGDFDFLFSNNYDKKKKKFKLSIGARYAEDKESGMVVMEINILTGFSLINDEHFKSQQRNKTKHIEITSSKIIVYFEELTIVGVGMDFFFEQILPVYDVKPALVKIYCYYNPGSKASGFYSIHEKGNWISYCPNCCDDTGPRL